jgi:hypothetical protein
VEKIVNGLEAWQRQYQSGLSQQTKRFQELSKEETAKRNEVFIASIFGKYTYGVTS